MTERRARNFSKDAKIAALASIVFEIPHEHQKAMHEDQVNSLLEWHHNTPYAEDGTNHFSNAVPMLRAAHRERTAKIDIPAIAKGKRIRQNKHLRRYKEILKYEGPAAAAELYPAVERLLRRRKSKIPSRPFPKQHRPFPQGRGFQRRRP